MYAHKTIKLALSDVFIHWLLLCVLYFAQPASSQPLQTEHLQRYKIPVFSDSDTAEIEQLIRKGVYHMDSSHEDSSLFYFRKAVRLSNQLGYAHGSIKALNNIAIYHFRKKEFNQSILLFLQSLRYPIPADSTHLKAKLLYNIGLSYVNVGLYDKSITFLNLALANSLRRNTEKETLWRIYSELGLSFQYKGQYETAAYYYYTLLTSVKQPNSQNYTYAIDAYNRLAAIQLKLNLVDRAFTYFNQASSLALQFKDTAMLAKIIVNKGVAYSDLKDTIMAEKLYRQGYELAKRKGLREVQHTAARNLANILAERNELHAALRFALEADSISVTTSDYDGKINVRYTLGYIYLQLQQYKKAETYLTEAQKLMYKMGLTGNTMNAHEALAYVYAAQGRYREAFEEERNYAKMNDSLRGTFNAAAVNELEIKYQVAQKDRGLLEQRLLIAQQESRLRKNQLWLAGISIIALLLISVLTGIYRRSRHKQKLQASMLQNLKQQQELNQLRAQVQGEELERKRMARELHDGISSQLYALRIHVLTLKNKPNGLLSSEDMVEVLQQLEDAGLEIRATAHNLAPDLVVRDGLLMAVAALCERTEKCTGLEVQFLSYGTIPRLEAIVELSLYRMVQELIQNVLKHAQASRILVQFSYQNGILNVTIEDDGIGLDTSDEKYRQGSGLAGIAARIPALHGQMDIKSIPGKGTAIYLELNIGELSVVESLI